MAKANQDAGLTKEEKRVVKALFTRKWRNQDIQALVNTGRKATVNFGRFSGVKKDEAQKAASDEEVAAYLAKKYAYNARTGLNAFDDERLIRAREAIVLAVQIFNSTALNFKTEIFAVLVNIGWTYLLHEYYDRKGVAIVDANGNSLLLSQMIVRPDCPLSEGIRNNLGALKVIRNSVEHKLLGRADAKWFGMFQACCLNFNKALCDMFGERLSLAEELGFALQFSRPNVEHMALAMKYDVPAHIDAIDAKLAVDFTEAQRADLEYEFRVIYTLSAAAKTRAHIEFVRPESAEGKEIQNVLVQYHAADHLYPHKPGQVCKLVSQRTGKAFTSHNHTQAWKLHKVRPGSNAKQPENTVKDFCIYHAAHRDYTFSEKWVERLVDEVNDDAKFAAIKGVKVN